MKSTNPNKLSERDNEAIKNENALQRRQRRNANRGITETADWHNADAELIRGLIETVTGQKGTITLGYTRDGGAYYISYYFGDSSEAIYCRPSEGIDNFLTEEIESFKQIYSPRTIPKINPSQIPTSQWEFVVIELHGI